MNPRDCHQPFDIVEDESGEEITYLWLLFSRPKRAIDNGFDIDPDDGESECIRKVLSELDRDALIDSNYKLRRGRGIVSGHLFPNGSTVYERFQLDSFIQLTQIDELEFKPKSLSDMKKGFAFDSVSMTWSDGSYISIPNVSAFNTLRYLVKINHIFLDLGYTASEKSLVLFGDLIRQFDEITTYTLDELPFEEDE